jgi:hypothetical protein
MQAVDVERAGMPLPCRLSNAASTLRKTPIITHQ